MGAGGFGGGHWAIVGGFESCIGVVWAGIGSSIDDGLRRLVACGRSYNET